MGTKGMRYTSYNFDFFDLFAAYDFKIKGKHQLRFTQGISLGLYTSDYIKELSFIEDYPSPGMYHLGALVLEDKKETTLGGITTICYNYLLWKRRLSIGAEVGMRYYFDFPFQVMIGPRLSFNF